MSRRKFLLGGAAVAGGGMLIGFTAYGVSESRSITQAAKLTEASGSRLLAGWVTLSPDDVTTVLIPHVDIGQGVHTALAMMLAEELDADWLKVRTHQAPADAAFANWFLAEGYTIEPGRLFSSGVADPIFKIVARRIGLQITGGSTAVSFTGAFGMRHVGACARQMLMEAAADRWNVPVTSLITRDSRVVHEPTRRTFRYGELVDSAAEKAVPLRPKLKPKGAYRLVGQSVPRLDIPAKVRGTFGYGIDLQLPKLRYATAKAAPVHGGALTSVDESPALAIAGVEHVVKMQDAVAVVAAEPWQAFAAIETLAPVFSTAHGANVTSQSIYEEQVRALNNGARETKLEIGNVREASNRARRVHEALYRSPFLHHAQMEPVNITAQWLNNRLTVWSGAHDPLTARKVCAEIARLPIERVMLHPLPIGGSFGRKTGPDQDNPYYRQAIEIARACTPNPVKLIWTRAEDTAQGHYRPQVSSRIRATLGDDGLPSTWAQVFIEGQPGRSIAYPIPYDIPHQQFDEVRLPNHVRKGPLRSVNSTQHAFWRESFIDELAHAAQRDPLEYRLALLRRDQRAQRVLEVASDRSHWTSQTAGVGRGLALHVEYGTRIATVIEASWQGSSVKVHRAWAVVDCGELVHPDTAAQQIEGAIIMGLSSAIDEEITIADGAVTQQSFSDYRLLTLADTPEIDVHFVNSDAPAGGLGEVGMAPTPAALANALFSATGHRLRSTPLNSELRHLAQDRALTRV